MSTQRILHVDDDPDICEVVRLSLALDPGLQVKSCASGREAVQLCRDFRPDLVLCDVLMPDMDGPATLAALRDDPETAGIPVVFMTARAQPRELERFARLGALGVIVKPFDPMRLAGAVRQHLRSAERVGLGRGADADGALQVDPGDRDVSKTEAEETRPYPDSRRLPLRILVVDDIALNRDLAVAILRKAGHRPEAAEDGAIAVRMAGEVRYDLVLMDIQMPGIDGIEATRQIQQHGPPFGHVPVVAMTANVLPHQVAQYLGAGMVDYIGKPVDAERLLEALPYWVKRESPKRSDKRLEARRPRVLDRESWAELAALVGSDRVLRFATELRASLAADKWRMTTGEAVLPLQKAAHACVSLAGQIGFVALSNAASELESACLDGSDIEVALARFDKNRAQAVEELDRLIGRDHAAPAATA